MIACAVRRAPAAPGPGRVLGPAPLLATVLLASLTGLLASLTGPAHAQARSYAIESFRVSLRVHDDASLGVEETIAFAFRGSHQGIYRLIPVRYERQGFDYALRVDQVQALDESGRALKMEVSYPGRYLKVKAWVPGARDATRAVTIRYRVRRGLLAFDDHDELYWNVTGNEWAAPIRRAEAAVTLPPTVPADAVRTLAFTGPLGAAGRDYAVERADTALLIRATRPLAAREGLTVVVGWPSGHVRFSSRWQELGWTLLDQRWFALPLGVLAGCLVAWRRFGRDPELGRSVKPEYEPPPGLKPGEAGAIVDETVHPRDLLATVVDLAVRGYVHIEQVSAGGLLERADYRFTLTRPWQGDPGVAGYEQLIFGQMFGITTRRLLSEIRRDSRATLAPVRDRLYRDLVRHGYFLASPQTVRRLWGTIGGALLAVPLAVLAPAVMEEGFPVSASALLAVSASGLALLAFSRVMPRKTPKGARTRWQVLGFQEFLERAEQDRLRRLPPDTLHRWLPYAIALGVEEAWIANFEGLAVDPPSWYESDQPFSIRGYAGLVDGFGRDVRSAWLTAARGSDGGSSGGGGGSGFSGGSSGGGGGGGGGGTF